MLWVIYLTNGEYALSLYVCSFTEFCPRLPSPPFEGGAFMLEGHLLTLSLSPATHRLSMTFAILSRH